MNPAFTRVFGWTLEERVEVSISGTGFFDNQRRLQDSVITIQDITAHKKTEQFEELLCAGDFG